MSGSAVMKRAVLRLALVATVLSAPTALLAQGRAGADTPGKTASGLAYIQPKDWAMTQQGGATVFASPEADLNIAVVEVGAAANAQAAAAKAWSIYKPSANRTVRLATPGTAADGWDERVSIAYDTSPGSVQWSRRWPCERAAPGRSRSSTAPTRP